jgi:hypothetical protein
LDISENLAAPAKVEGWAFATPPPCCFRRRRFCFRA